MKRIGRLVRIAAVGSSSVIAAALLVAMGSTPATADEYTTPFALINYNTAVTAGNLDCLGINYNNGDAQQQNCTFGGSQSWRFDLTWEENGWAPLVNSSTQSNKRCLSVQDGSKSTNAQLTGYTCLPRTRPDQFWMSTRLPDFTLYGDYPCYIFASSPTPKLIAGVSGASTKAGANVLNANPANTTGNGYYADIWCEDVLS
jgi:hypothetical protein